MELYKEKKKIEKFELNGSEYEFYTREPETEDRCRYLANSVKKVRGKIIDNLENVYQNKYESGCDLITGFPENNSEGNPQFEFQGKSISSEKDSPNYRKDWKELILPNFFNQVLVFSTKVYEGIDLKTKMEDVEKQIESEVMDNHDPLENKS